MSLSISTDAVAEKNKLASSDPWLLLLEVIYPSEPSIRLVWNTEDVTWDSETWQAASFKLGDIEESQDGSVPVVSLSIVDIERNIIPTVDAYGGGVGAQVIIRVVHNAHLDNTTPEVEYDMEIVSASVDSKGQINFRLGAENLTNYRSPPDMYLKIHCRYAEFKGPECGYGGAATDCDRTWERCKELENQNRFGGFPGIGRLGIVQ